MWLCDLLKCQVHHLSLFPPVFPFTLQQVQARFPGSLSSPQAVFPGFDGPIKSPWPGSSGEADLLLTRAGGEELQGGCSPAFTLPGWGSGSERRVGGLGGWWWWILPSVLQKNIQRVKFSETVGCREIQQLYRPSSDPHMATAVC